MFKEEISLDFDSKEIIRKINDYLFNKDNISAVYLFGSFDTEDFTSSSDIDIAVLGNTTLAYAECLKLNSELEDLIGLPIDLNNIEALPEYIQVQVVMGNRQLFSKDDVVEQKFLDKLNYWIKTELPFWRKLMS